MGAGRAETPNHAHPGPPPMVVGRAWAGLLTCGSDVVTLLPEAKYFSGSTGMTCRLQLRGQCRFLTSFPLSPRGDSREPKQSDLGVESRLMSMYTFPDFRFSVEHTQCWGLLSAASAAPWHRRADAGWAERCPMAAGASWWTQSAGRRIQQSPEPFA